MRRSKSTLLFDFSGGLNNTSPNTALKINEGLDLDNINLLPYSGFEKRYGNSVFNSSAMSSGNSVHGIGYYRLSDASEFMMAIAGNKIYSSSSLSGTMSDVTGALTITSGNNNLWNHVIMNNYSIFIGGNRATDVPIKYTGTGNASALGGTPPVGDFGIVQNNRLFIGNTISNPSRIQWCILGNPENWTGDGSGSQDVNGNDGDVLVGAGRINVDHLILFKQNSIHDLVTRTSPFPLFPLFKGVGAISKRGIVEVGDMIYFITPEPRMVATNGREIFYFPDTIDSLWDNLNKSRLKYIHGVYYPRLHQIMWFCSNGASDTHDICLIWDLDKKCWLKHSTGYKMNVSCIAQDRLLYVGAYDGKIYKQDDRNKNIDDSETSPGTIDAYWKSGWIDFDQMINSKTIPYIDFNFVTQDTGTFDYSYGYDFTFPLHTETIDMTTTGGVYGSAIYGVDVYGGITDKTRLIFNKGRGKFFQYRIRNSNANQAFGFNRLELPIEQLAPTELR